MNYLNDDNLEDLGLIKGIDTLKIIKEANEIKEKRKSKLLFILFIVILITAFIGQILFIQVFSRFNFMRMSAYIYVFISIVLALVLIDKGDKSLC